LDRGNERSGEGNLKYEFPYPLGIDLQYLIASGHSLNNIFIEQQKGIPYCGWTLPQYRYWSHIVVRYMKQVKISQIQNLTDAIDGSFTKIGRKKLQQKLSKLDNSDAT